MYSHVSHQLFPWDDIVDWVPQVETHASSLAAVMVAVEDARL
jgi:hypothetical protein